MTSGLIQFIMLIVVIVLSLTLSIFALIKARKEGFTRRWIAILVLALGLLFITYLAYNRGEIEPAGWAQILLMLVLVSVTGSYAWSASKQADASVKMAEEMKEQTFSEARPYLLIRLEDEFIRWDPESNKPSAKDFTVKILNAGKGPAINLWVALWYPKKEFFGERKGYLVTDEEWQTKISRLSTSAVELGIKKDGWLPQLKEVIKNYEPGVVAVEYQDIHKRIWVSYLRLERHVDVTAIVIEGEQNIVELKEK